MQKFVCKKCSRIDFLERIDDEEYICSDCKKDIDKNNQTIIDTDIEAIIDSMVINEKKENNKIINRDFEDKSIKIDEKNNYINKIKEKCINCGQCKKVCENIANIKYNLNIIDNPICTACGQCILNCPTGALTPKYTYREVKDIINKNDKIVIAIVSSGVKVSIGDNFGMEYGTNNEGKIITALRKLGFDYVFNTGFGVDISILEEVSSFANRINNNLPLPQFTSCCPAWVRYAEIYHPELLDNISTCKSPIGCMCTLIKTYFAEKKNIDPNKIVTVALTPCTAQKLEAKEYSENIDYVITANELSLLLKEEEINLNNIQESEYDKDFSSSSGASALYTTSGGVMQAILRTMYKMYTGKKPNDTFLEMEEFENNKLLENDYYKKLHLIEVMNCEGGCVAGGGQPLCQIAELEKVTQKRTQTIKFMDKNKKERCSYQNKEIMKIYKEYLGNPLSEKCLKLLHTSYTNKSNILRKSK